MNNCFRYFLISLMGLTMAPFLALAEDIDLFASGLTAGSASSSLPNVIFVLDNTSNWLAATTPIMVTSSNIIRATKRTTPC